MTDTTTDETTTETTETEAPAPTPDTDVAGLKRKVAELLADKRKLKGQIEEEARKRTDAELAAKGLLEHKQKWDAEILSPVKSRLEALEAENRQLKLVGPVKDALHKAGAVDPDAAWQLEAHRFDLDETGKPYLKDDPTAPLDKWIAEQLPKQRPYLFAGTKAGGGGAAGAKGAGGPVGKAAHPREWTQQERAEYLQEHGLEKYQRMVSDATRRELDAKK
jgi:hypothetical protein